MHIVPPRLTCREFLSALYYALLHNGYDVSGLGREDGHALLLQRFATPQEAQPFFAQAR